MTPAADNNTVTLLAQNLRKLVLTSKSGRRYPALETVISKGHHFRAGEESPDHFRFRLFGMEPEGDLPIAALTRASDGGQASDPGQYWLRVDPVTLWADMARLVMTRHGLADLDPFESNEIENIVRSVLLEEGIHLQADHPERWSIALSEPLGFNFTSLDDALGMDVADAMLQQPESRHWRQIMNEIQMALHACPVNIRRRQQGLQEINSVWFWGGGFLPDSNKHMIFDTVYSDNPVSRGLAAINDSQLKFQNQVNPDDLFRQGQSVLLDWTCRVNYPDSELAGLENLTARLLEKVHGNATELVLYCGRQDGWRYRRKSARKFWRRRRSLDELCKIKFPE